MDIGKRDVIAFVLGAAFAAFSIGVLFLAR